MRDTKWVKIFLFVLLFGGVTGGIATYYINQDKKELQPSEQKPEIKDDKKEDQKDNLDEENIKDDHNDDLDLEQDDSEDRKSVV